jgi:hypothetical protein
MTAAAKPLFWPDIGFLNRLRTARILAAIGADRQGGSGLPTIPEVVDIIIKVHVCADAALQTLFWIFVIERPFFEAFPLRAISVGHVFNPRRCVRAAVFVGWVMRYGREALHPHTRMPFVLPLPDR